MSKLALSNVPILQSHMQCHTNEHGTLWWAGLALQAADWLAMLGCPPIRRCRDSALVSVII